MAPSHGLSLEGQDKAPLVSRGQLDERATIHLLLQDDVLVPDRPGRSTKLEAVISEKALGVLGRSQAEIVRCAIGIVTVEQGDARQIDIGPGHG